MGPYNTPHILTFLDRLHNIVTAVNQMHQMHYTVIWDNVSFHRSALVQNWDWFMISGPRLRYPSFRPWRRPVTKSTLQLCKDGFQDRSHQSPVMLMKFSGQIQLGRRDNVQYFLCCISNFFRFFFFLFVLYWIQYFTFV